MSKDKPEVGDLYEILSDKVVIIYVDDEALDCLIYFEGRLGTIPFPIKFFNNNAEYLGKSKANIDDLFKTENEE